MCRASSRALTGSAPALGAWRDVRHGVLRVSLGVALLAAAVLGVGSSARALPGASRVIDRTFGCTPLVLEAPLSGVDVNAVPKGAKEAVDPRQEPSPGFIGVASGGRAPLSDLVAVRARGWARFARSFSPAGVYASRTRCSSSRLRVPLSAQGLAGPPVRWAKRATCLVRGRVFVRVRAVLRTPSSWQRVSTAYAGAPREVLEAAVAVRSERTGKLVAYLELDRTGSTKLWFAPTCQG
jgi:hypothetical protein